MYAIAKQNNIPTSPGQGSKKILHTSRRRNGKIVYTCSMVIFVARNNRGKVEEATLKNIDFSARNVSGSWVTYISGYCLSIWLVKSKHFVYYYMCVWGGKSASFLREFNAPSLDSHACLRAITLERDSLPTRWLPALLCQLLPDQPHSGSPAHHALGWRQAGRQVKVSNAN